MDNASFHFSERIEQMLEEAGVVRLFQSPYSPDVSPIERFFGELRIISGKFGTITRILYGKTLAGF